MTMTATYSPDDNKVRLYSTTRLDPATTARLKAAGFRWAPKQALWVAPMWTPAREDLLLELAGEIDDDDTSLVARAEARAERFEGYSAARAQDATQHDARVHQRMDGIPLGQPILVGHHSEARARRDQARLREGTRQAVQCWRQSQYWQQRAAAARQHARYHARPDVRARRLKKLEAAQRRFQTRQAEHTRRLDRWTHPALTFEQALHLAHDEPSSQPYPLAAYPRPAGASAQALYEGERSLWSALEAHLLTVEQARAIMIPLATAVLASSRRWLDHLAMRLLYERAMLEDGGGLPSDQLTPEAGGGCQCWASPPGGWSLIVTVNTVSVTIHDTWSQGGTPFRRTIPFDQVRAFLPRHVVATAQAEGRYVARKDGCGFALLEPPGPDAAPSQPEAPGADPDTAVAPPAPEASVLLDPSASTSVPCQICRDDAATPITPFNARSQQWECRPAGAGETARYCPRCAEGRQHDYQGQATRRRTGRC